MIERIALIAALALTALPAVADDDQIAVGREMAALYCQDCHAIGETDTSTYAPAPRFRDLYKRYDVDLLAEALVEGIVTAHPAMPEFEFDPYQAQAVIEYLKSLNPDAE